MFGMCGAASLGKYYSVMKFLGWTGWVPTPLGGSVLSPSTQTVLRLDKLIVGHLAGMLSTCAYICMTCNGIAILPTH